MINLNLWKLTLPIGKKGKPTEIGPKQLADYSSEWFYWLADALVMVCGVGGVTTGNTKYNRTELRELNADGTLAAWATNQGQHDMVFDVAVEQMPGGNKPECVIGQIHGGGDDVTTFRFITNANGLVSIWISSGDKSRAYLVTDAYQLGQRIRLGFHAGGGVIRYSVDGKFVPFSLAVVDKDCYFKVGLYPQTLEALVNGVPNGARLSLFGVTVTHKDGVIEPPPPTDLAAEVAALRAEVKAIQSKLAALKGVL